ncbi:TetR/AcrR family transcriptional regulator [Actinomadura sp. WMMB 499]|uniref:TetR/AcrR family transcriptional regulator n=1 Tax=Actinomadura sp. WMMB 499 TaxID=1219491 RepID=UPI00124629C2|nr:TetR/AcrR family transcriptional regulator [Actinomadura sp. WMMB 499]QFG25619.1 TetR/AcrR family transcriptional regulator [Actinomadura sp. WMMB 499]
MPRVSEEHLERRRKQILDAARACFIRQGVHATSMQDIFAEAGLSAGAVYRYFKSKNEIIEAILSTVVGDLHTSLRELVDADPVPPPDEVLELIATRAIEMSGEDGILRLAPQGWALALYDPEIGRYVAATIVTLRETWIRYVRRLVGAGLLPADTDVVATGKALFGVVPGFLLQRLILDDVDPAEIGRGARGLLAGLHASHARQAGD